MASNMYKMRNSGSKSSIYSALDNNPNSDSDETDCCEDAKQESSRHYLPLTNKPMVSNWSKFKLLIWKNWTLQKRHPIQTAIEIFTPVLFSILLVLVRNLVNPEFIDDLTISQPFSPANLSVPVLESYFNNNTVNFSETFLQPKILYSPRSPILRRIMETTAMKLNMKVEELESEAELVKRFNIMTQYETYTSLAGVVFEDTLLNKTSLPKDIKIKFRFPAELRARKNPVPWDHWLTFLLFPIYRGAEPKSNFNDKTERGPDYQSEGFLALQHHVSSSLAEYLVNISLPEIYLQKFPQPPFIHDTLFGIVQNVVPLLILLAFSYTSINITKAIALEKELQLKEAMKIMGLPNWLHWSAWFVKNFVLIIISVILIVVVLKVHWPSSAVAVLRKTDWSILLVFLILYCVTTICFCFMISSFFSKARTAATVSGFGYLATYIPYSVLQSVYQDWSFSCKIALSFLSNTAMAIGFKIIVMYEGTGEGLQWDNIWEPVSTDDNITCGHIMAMLVLDGVIYLTIAVYVEAVFPGTYGVPQPWYFPFQLSFWCGRSTKEFVELELPERYLYNKNSLALSKYPPFRAGIKIENLKKVYGQKIAVNNLKMEIYEDQITVLLGHNGAGKTTTINMLTGMVTPTDGTAKIYDYDINTDINCVRGCLGYCPQHDILFNELTVAEHIYFFCKLRGLNNIETKQEIKKYLDVLDLEDKENEQIQTLSGGSKRKLSAALALCGNSKVVICDEPTAGVDVASRRKLWELLQEEKKGRTILFTTHFMDEADLLGDRIAIMVNGELQCCDTSFSLKKNYGVGYQLTVTRGSDCKVNAVTSTIHDHIPDAEVHQDIDSEITYLLRGDKSHLFEAMLKKLEDDKEALDILTIGISQMTIEQVFIKNYNDNETNNHIKNQLLCNDYTDIELIENNTHLIAGAQLYMNQVQAMFLKYVLNSARNWLLFLIHFLIPLSCLLINFFLNDIVTQNTKDQPELSLSLQKYGSTYTLMELLDKNNKTREYFELYGSQVMNGHVEKHEGMESSNMVNYVLSLFQHGKSLHVFKQKYIVGSTFDYDEHTNNSVFVGWFNAQPYHAAPVSLNLLHNVILKCHNFSLSVSNHPLPFRQKSKVALQHLITDIGFLIPFTFIFTTSFLVAYFSLFQIKERTSSSKNLQSISGVNSVVYWLVSYIWDLFLFSIIIASIITTMVIFEEPGFDTPAQLGLVSFMLLCYAVTTIPMVYVVSHIFDTPEQGYSRIFMLSIILGMGSFVCVSLVKNPELEFKDLYGILDTLCIVLIPMYSMARGIGNIYVNEISKNRCEPYVDLCTNHTNICCRDPKMCPDGQCLPIAEKWYDWDAPGIGFNALCLLTEAVIFIIFLILIELKVFHKIATFSLKNRKVSATILSNTTEDPDVSAERIHVKNAEPDFMRKDNFILLRDLSKYYKKLIAVDKLCISIKRGECFGLLGTNGAGKTSTFKMLTGVENISSGEAYIYGYNIKTSIRKAYKVFGYCPQYDTVIEDLTGREALKMFCLLRGIPCSDIKSLIRHLGDELMFSKHLDKKVKEFSGGNKRKLSTAVALIGNPPILFLDEPTSGMDPIAKRHFWKVISKIRDSGRCVILTSHSMEECEALCTRIAIMVNGQLRCLGSPQHLKSKYAEGFTLTIKVAAFEKSLHQSIVEFVTSSFQGATLNEEYGNIMTFHVPIRNTSWSAIFGVMEKSKRELNIEDYSLGQINLEQVFLSFTKSDTLS